MPQQPRRWRPAPLIRASFGLHGAAAGALVLQPGLWPWWLGALVANHAVLTASGMLPHSALLGPNMTRLPPGASGRIALTFDDGPDPDVTPRVLDLLGAAGQCASFFLVGKHAARHPALVRRILAEGHSAENHSHTHPWHFATLGPRGQWNEVSQAQRAILEAGGKPRFFRPPIGLRSPFLDPVLARAGLHLANWSRRGADGALADPARILHRLRAPRAGEILLLHDGNCRAGPDGRAVVLSVLPELLRRIADAGLNGVTLPAAAAGAIPATATAAESPASGGYASR
ncbi:polysaccharide deacetylase family protein [Pseudoroseomonas globiformis]|uniref:Chitooligosaccharide deacetylase n=1 Tax=Teichococcus globiformis TaxID=2307229 RepID=A0ABV7G1A3_9PROT